MNKINGRHIKTITGLCALLPMVLLPMAHAEPTFESAHASAAHPDFVVDTSMSQQQSSTLLLLLHQPWASIAPRGNPGGESGDQTLHRTDRRAVELIAPHVESRASNRPI